jgi:hypothetical protein
MFKNIVITIIFINLLWSLTFAQHTITIDGNFEDWSTVPVAVSDPADDVHDTDGYPDGGTPLYREYSDVDILEVKFTNDAENLYGYMRASGIIGRTSSDTLGHQKNGRYYFIFTIDVDDNKTTGYQLKDGGYYPDSEGYDMNMEVEFYNGGFNTGHYINHEFTSEEQLNNQGWQDLADGFVRLAPGSYDYYTQWVTFEDSSYVIVEDKGEVFQGIITIAVSPDGHQAEIKAPMWGFLKTPEGQRIIDVGQNIVVSASLEGSGELSEEAIKNGHTPGSVSEWGSDTAEPFEYFIVDPLTPLAENSPQNDPLSSAPYLFQNYPNPFNSQTKITFVLPINQDIILTIYDIIGREIAILYRGNLTAGKHTFFWNGMDNKKALSPTGTYFIYLKTPTTQIIRTMTYLK